MNVKVKFFAIARDLVGKDEMLLSLPEHASTTTVIDKLIERFPKFQDWKPYIRIAVNYEYVPQDHKLKDNDEIAIIPPVSGG